LITLGYSVPAGFVISKSASVSSVTRLKNAGDAVGGNFAQQLQSAYRRLGVDAVAVRSSAEGEDSEVGSQAGIHASHLNVIGETALLESVEAVWADAAEAGEPIAIVVQAMLNPESAGVLFTRSPESPDQCLIESVWGLGVAAVSGAPCDVFSVGRSDRQVTRRIANKHSVVVAAPGGGTRLERCPPARVTSPSLSTTQVLELTSVAIQLEEEMGRPLDIEWAVVDGRIHLLQARPLAEPDKWLSPPRVSPDDLWSRVNMAELFPDPITPFTWSLEHDHWTELIEESVDVGRVTEMDNFDFFQLFDHRLYFNVGAAYKLHTKRAGRAWQSALTFNEGPDQIGLEPGTVHLPTLALNLPHILATRLRRAWRRRAARMEFEAAEQLASVYGQMTLGSNDPRELWQLYKVVWSEIMRLQRIEIAVDNAVFAANGWLETLSRRWLGDASVVKSVLPAERTTSGAIALDLADLVAGAPPEARAWLLAASGTDLAALRRAAPGWCEDLEAFLRRHGHRARGELEWAQPRWVEDPTPVLEVIRGCLSADRPLYRATPSDDKTGWEQEAKQRIREHRAERLVPWRSYMFRAALRRARRLLPMRSLPRDRVMLLYLAGRRVLQRLGGTLIEMGVLQTEDELFYLTVGEIEASLTAAPERGTRERIQRRKVERTKAAARSSPLLRDAGGHPIIESGRDGRGEDAELKGRGVVPGIVEGPVRLLLGPGDLSRVQLGDVLVMPLTDIGLVLLFPMAAAMIVEQGGLLSHASVLAREYRIPTVIQVRGATHKLTDGEIVSVDGESGVVRRVRPGWRAALEQPHQS
jgi:pyruvate,water dikinase